MCFCEREHEGNGGVRKSVKLKQEWRVFVVICSHSWSFVVIHGHWLSLFFIRCFMGDDESVVMILYFLMFELCNLNFKH